jgi:hypothetical protein
MTEDDFIAPDLRHARAHMSDSEYRRKYGKLDFVHLADQQKAVVNSSARYTAAIAGNQSGKTHVGAFRVACEALNRYPEWHTGRRVPKPKIDRSFDRVIWCVAPIPACAGRGTNALAWFTPIRRARPGTDPG